MSTITIAGNQQSNAENDQVERRDPDARSTPASVRLGRLGIVTAGVVAVLTSLWGGIVPYVGPIFGYSGDGSGAWHWSLPHGVLALAPGAVGVLLGLFLIAESRGIVVGRGRVSLATASTLLMLCGAWFAIGPLAWPVISSGGSYFVASTHLRVLSYELGYSIGTGLVLVACGAFADGCASRHQPRTTLLRDASSTSEAVSGPIESGI